MLQENRFVRALERLPKLISLVGIAASAAERSEEQRTALARKPRNGAPRGWRLARELLSQWGIPEELLPKRREAWLPRHAKETTRQEASRTAQIHVRQAAMDARRKYNAALQAARRDFAAELMRTSKLARGPNSTRHFVLDTETGQPVWEPHQHLTKVKEAHNGLLLQAEEAEKAYESLIRHGSANVNGQRLSLSLPCDSSFWTILMCALHDIYVPIVEQAGGLPSSVRAALFSCYSDHQGYSPEALIKRTLATIAPAHHLDSSVTSIRDRVSKS